MPNQTPNYNLTKPLQTENYNVDVFNTNADIIDTTLKQLDTTLKEKANKNNAELTGKPTINGKELFRFFPQSVVSDPNGNDFIDIQCDNPTGWAVACNGDASASQIYVIGVRMYENGIVRVLLNKTYTGPVRINIISV